MVEEKLKPVEEKVEKKAEEPSVKEEKEVVVAPEEEKISKKIDMRFMASAKAIRRKLRKKKGAILARRKKEFTYRGYTLDQLQKMPLNELIPIMPARARRSLKRGLNEENQTFVDRLLSGSKPILRTHRRDVLILPKFIGKRISIHNGKEFKELEIKPEMLWHYLGEFVLTRKFPRHSGPGVGATRSSKFMPLK